MYGYIYKTTNLINGKCYIGKHKSDKFDDTYYGSGKYFTKALNKYGKDNFKVEILESCDDEKELNECEKKHIQQVDAVNSKMFYNMAFGGDGGDLYSGMSECDKESFKLKCSKSLKNKIGIHKNNKRRYVNEEDVNKFLSNGWELGHPSVSDEQKCKTHNSMMGRKWITNGIDNVFINPNDLEIVKAYFDKGYNLGRTPTTSQTQNYELKRVQKEKKLLEKELAFLNSSPKCECCGVTMTVLYGSGRFCSKSCASTHSHTDDTKDKIRKMNVMGVCGNKGKHFSDEHKDKISTAVKNYYTTNSSKWVHKGEHSTRVTVEELSQYLSNGYSLGRGNSIKGRTPWNKGLTKNSDERIKSYTQSREKTMLERYGTLNGRTAHKKILESGS